jgi:hypothetical protein
LFRFNIENEVNIEASFRLLFDIVAITSLYVSMATSGLGYHLNHNFFYCPSGDEITLLAGNFVMPLTLLH